MKSMSIEQFENRFSGRKLSTDENAEASQIQKDQVNAWEMVEWTQGEDSLLLKWGGLKGWNFKNNEKAGVLIEKFFEEPVCESAILHKSTENQKEIICQIIDCVDGVIQNDWNGEYYTKEKAKEYVMNYGSD